MSEIKQLRGKLEIANSERSELQNRVNQTTSQMKRLTGDLEAAGAKGNELQNSLNQAMSEIDKLKRKLEAARSENRPLSNLIETAALARIRERQFADDVEMAEILEDEALVERLRAGSVDARKRRGSFVE